MHKCIRCAAIYQDNDSTILRGCKNCGSIFFLYIKSAEHEQEIQKIEKALEQRDTSLEKEITKEIEKIEHIPEPTPPSQVSQTQTSATIEVTRAINEKKIEEIKFGVETVKIPQEGIYEINIEALLEKQPVVILERGRVYFIHLPSAFDKITERVKK